MKVIDRALFINPDFNKKLIVTNELSSHKCAELIERVISINCPGGFILDKVEPHDKPNEFVIKLKQISVLNTKYTAVLKLTNNCILEAIKSDAHMVFFQVRDYVTGETTPVVFNPRHQVADEENTEERFLAKLRKRYAGYVEFINCSNGDVDKIAYSLNRKVGITAGYGKYNIKVEKNPESSYIQIKIYNIETETIEDIYALNFKEQPYITVLTERHAAHMHEGRDLTSDFAICLVDLKDEELICLERHTEIIYGREISVNSHKS